MHFIHKIQYFEEFVHKIALFFFFLKLVLPGFRSIEIMIKIFNASCVNNVHASYRIVISIFFVLTCSLPLVFLVFFLVLFYLSYS